MAVVQKLLSHGGFGGSSNGSCLTNQFVFSSQHIAIPIAVAGAFRNWRVQTTAPGEDIALTIKKNGSNTALSLSFAASDTVKSDSDSVSFAAGDLFDIQRTANPGTVASSMLEWVPDDGESQLYSFTCREFASGRYVGLLNTCAGEESATESSASSLVGVAGTITTLRINTGAAPSGGQSRVYTIYKNGVAQDGSGGTTDTRITQTSGNATASGTFTLSVAAGDRISLNVTATGGAANTDTSGSIAFVGATETVMYGGATTETLGTTAATVYFEPYPETDEVSSTTEGDVEQIGADGLTIGGMRIYLVGAPGTGDSRVYTLRKNGVDTDLSVSLSGATQAGVDSATEISIGYADEWALKEVRTGTPDGSVVKYVFTSGSTLSTLNSAFGANHDIVASTHCHLAGIDNSVSGAVNCQAHGEGANVAATQTTYFNQTTTPDTETDDHVFRVDADTIKLNGDVEVNGSPIGGGGNSFTTISVSGQSDVVADSSSDTLTLVAGSNVTITTNAGTDTITIASTGGSGGGLVLLEQHTASSSATLDFTTFYSSTYDDYQIEIVGLVVATNNVNLHFNLSSDGGSTFNTTSNYYYGFTGIANSGGTVAFSTGGGNDTRWVIASGISNASDRPLNGTLHLKAMGSTSLDKSLYGQMFFTNQTVVTSGPFQGLLDVGGTAFNAFRIAASSGNLASGTVRVYGKEK